MYFKNKTWKNLETCMKALTPEIVYDQTIKLIKEIESKNVKEQYSV